MKYLLVLLLLVGCVSNNQVQTLNDKINNDMVYWDNPIDWQLPKNNMGDCTSFAMLKQIELAKLGIDSNLAVCYTRDFKGHVVLIVGDDWYTAKMLDINEPYYSDVKDSDYIFVLIQDGDVWLDHFGNLTNPPKGLK